MNRGWRFALLLVGVLVAVVLVAGDRGSDPGSPLSPTATGPAGARATVLLLEELGADVQVERGVPSPSTRAALLLRDTLSDERRDDLRAWVEGGGTLVVADPRSPLAAEVVGPVGEALGDDVTLERQVCTIDDLDGAERLRLGDGVTFVASAPAASCFGDGQVGFVVEDELGRGRVRSVGGPYPFTNEGLDEEDNAVLVAGLTAPVLEGARAAFLDEAPLGEGDETLVDLVPDRVVAALVQLGIAFLAYVWFRARRLGRPVAEPQPTTMAGSELVEAVGRLLQQERTPNRSAERLRQDLRRTLARRLGMAPDAAVDDLVAAAERTGADPDRLRAVLEPRPVADDEALVALVREIDETRREVFHEHP